MGASGDNSTVMTVNANVFGENVAENSNDIV
jgi:hypothetical protein